MITDNETNTVYFSELLLKYLSEQCTAITDVLKKHKINYEFLKSTNDYFCRDYMPVQVERDKFVQFVFNPTSYFTKKEYGAMSNPVRVNFDNKLKLPYFSRLILDGGNVVKSKNKVIITDKVLTDNRYQMSDKEIINEIESLFASEVIIIPAIPGDDTGHSDGMIRFIDDDRVLINTKGFEQNLGWENKFLKALEDHHLYPEGFPVFEGEKAEGAIGIYINYLQIGNLILLPIFDHPRQKNDEAFKTITRLFPECQIEPVIANQIAIQGGVLNCCSWNILQSS